MKNADRIGFVDYMISRRKIKDEFFTQINTLIDWRPITNVIHKHYSKGHSETGRPSYEGIILFKMTLLQTWYGLSDYEVEDRVNDSISFSRFVGISLDDQVPDHSVISRFRSEMTKKKVYDKLFKCFNKQLDKHKILVKEGVVVDASIIDSPLKPKGKATYEVQEDRSEVERSEQECQKEQESQDLIKTTHPGVDTEAAWTKKAGKTRYGYKKHVVTDSQGLVVGVVTTPANINEIANLQEVLDAVELEEATYIYADKGYRSEKNEKIIADKKCKSRVLHKAKKNQPLTIREKKRNKLIGKVRFVVERTFGGIKRWFNSTCARYRGIDKMHTQNMMEAIAYNLYKSPGIIVSNCIEIKEK